MIRLSYDDLYTLLENNLDSHSHVLRLTALQLLQLSSEIPADSHSILRNTLAADSVPLTLQGARERNVHISKLVISVEDGNQVAARILARWLIGKRSGCQ